MTHIAPQPAFHKVEPQNTAADHFSHRPRCRSKPLDGHLFNAQIRRQAAHLHQLGVRPLTEFLIEFVGLDQQVRNDLLLLLERYARLDREVVEAVGAGSFPPAVFAVAEDVA